MGQYYHGTIKRKGERKWTAFNSHDFDNGSKLMEHSYINNPFVGYVKKLIFDLPTHVVWAGDYADPEKNAKPDPIYHEKPNLYMLAQVVNPKDKTVTQEELDQMRYLCNETKKLYVDYSKVKKDRYGYRIDPLPLLTAEGNGRGGGDYEGSNMSLIGSWARDLVFVTNYEIPRNYKELVPDFREGDEDDIFITQRVKKSK